MMKLRELLLMRIRNIAAEHLEVSNFDIDDDSNLKTLGDDLDFIELLMAIEEEFEIEIDEELEERICTPLDIADIVLEEADIYDLVEILE